MAQFLVKNAYQIDEGFIYGYLKNMGPYPGAILDLEQKSRVLGEVYQWNEINAISILSVLDHYEGYDCDNEEESEFLRRTVDVYGNCGNYHCYLYVYHPEWWKDKGQIIPSGNYLDVAL